MSLAAAKRVVAGMTNFDKHRRAWVRFWCAWGYNQARSQGMSHDPWIYDNMCGSACLADVQEHSKEVARKKGTKPQHATFKEARAAMTAMWRIVDPSTNFAEDTYVKLTAVGLRHNAPNTARYADTWDAALIPDYIMSLESRDEQGRNTGPFDMHHGELRKYVAILLRLHTCARSGDLAPNKKGRGGLYRGLYPHATMRCGLKTDADGSLDQVRWFMNKTISTRPDYFSKWFSLPAYRTNSPAHPWATSVCIRRLLEQYIALTEGLPREDDAVFITSRINADGCHTAIKADTLRNDCDKVMRLAGVPHRFLPHSVRHAALSGRTDASRVPVSRHTVEDALAHADVSKSTFHGFY